MKERLFQILLLALLTGSVLLPGCKKTKVSVKGDGPAVSGFNPAMASVGDTLTVYGIGFNADGISNKVTVNGSPATVLSGNANVLKLIVPDGAGKGTVSVQSSLGTFNSSDAFTLTDRLAGTIDKDLTLVANKVYLLYGAVHVSSGHTLTIQPGTLILGQTASAASLIISDGATAVWKGTVEQPIVFTSDQQRGVRKPGNWTGVIFEQNTSATDDQLNYVRVEFAGAHKANQLGAAFLLKRGFDVGDFDYVMASYSQGDGFQCSGTSTDKRYLSHAIAFGCAGNDFSVLGSSSASGQYLLSLKDPEFADPLGSDGMLVQSQTGSVISQYTYIGYNGLARKSTPYPFNTIGSLDYNTDITKNPNAGRGVHIGGLDLSLATPALVSGRLSLYNSVIAARWLAGISCDGAASWNAFGTDAGSNVANCFITRTLVSKAHSLAINTNVAPYSGGPLAKENVAGIGFEKFTLLNDKTKLVQFSNQNDTTKRLDLEQIPRTDPPYDDLGLKNLSDITFLKSPQVLPLSGSPLLEGADYPTGSDLAADVFFHSEDFIGAFGGEDWTQTWANFDPQNKSYY